MQDVLAEELRNEFRRLPKGGRALLVISEFYKTFPFSCLESSTFGKHVSKIMFSIGKG